MTLVDKEMRRFPRPNALSTLLLLLAALPFPLFAETIEGKVVKVYDGDTVTLDPPGGERVIVRLQGIDAPELSQRYGREARAHLVSLLLHQQVVVHWTKRDRHGRLVGKVIVGGRDVGRELLLAGLAWNFKRYEHEQSVDDRVAYAAAEAQARNRGMGLWRDATPIAPWSYREAKRQPRGAESASSR